MKRWTAFTCWLMLGALLPATTRYVDKGSPCPGSGTTGSPYCSIQNAVSAAVAGDDIRIRKASTPYNENVSTHASGTSGSPIIIESDDHANQPIWYYLGNGSSNGALQVGHNYWTVQYLDFDGTGIFTSRICVWMTGNKSSGFQFLHNTMRNWGGTMAQRGTSYDVNGLSLNATGAIVQFNLFDNVPTSIQSASLDNSLIDSNEIKNVTCGHNGGEILTGGIRLIDAGDNSTNPPTYGTVTFNNTIRNNSIHDFQNPSACTIGSMIDESGVHIDVGPANSTLQGNTVYNIPWSAAVGLWVEQDCHGWTIQNNIIHDIGGTGIRDNSQQTGGGGTGVPRNSSYHNTIYNIGVNGIETFGYSNIENNIVMNAGSTQIYADHQAVSRGNLTIDYNDYYDASGGHVGVWSGSCPSCGNIGVSSLSAWQTASGMDAHSISANPLFVNPPSDFHLQSSSPALTAGLSGTFMGALGANSGTVAPTITSFTATPSTPITPGASVTLAWASTGGLSATLNGSPVALSGSQTVSPLTTTAYTLVVSNPTGPASATQTVNVAPLFANYYVSVVGNDSNTGLTPSTAWRTISHASTSLSRGISGTIVHVAPGTYTEDVVTPTSGTASARITYISDTRWGAIIAPSIAPPSTFEWWNTGSYTDIQNFEVAGIYCGGIGQNASFQQAIGNNVHNTAAGCDVGSQGGSGIDDTLYTGQGNNQISNFVHDIGMVNSACVGHTNNSIQGIYHSHSGGIIANNLVVHVCDFGIHLWHAATNTIIVNNTSVYNRHGIIVGSGDAPCNTTGCSGDDNTSVINNIVAFNVGIGIQTEASNGGTVGTHNQYLNNLAYSNPGGDFVNNSPAPAIACSNCITGLDPLFVNNSGTATGDYHLLAGSPAVRSGTISDAPVTDFDGTVRYAPISIGAYQVPGFATGLLGAAVIGGQVVIH